MDGQRLLLLISLAWALATVAEPNISSQQVETGEVPGRTFSVDYSKNTLVKDGHAFRYISGSIHYSRVRPEDWKDRLTKMYAAGLNAIQTYVPWNFHERRKGDYIFTGDADLTAFIRTAQNVGLLVILRPGPYIDSEWEYGGLPWYLLQSNSSCRIRSMDKVYIAAVTRWMKVLLPNIKPLMYFNGGPIIMVQVENEYGAYMECDHQYMTYLRDLYMRLLGPQAVLFTTDGNRLNELQCGTVNGALATVDFGVGNGNVSEAFAALIKWQPNGPLINSEFYVGWPDNWGGPHHQVDPLSLIKPLRKLLMMGASVNIYMFAGGSTFGFHSGSEEGGISHVTSYDYDAPLTEAGDLTWKYFLLRSLFGEFLPLPQTPIPGNSSKHGYGMKYMELITSVSGCLPILSGGKPPVSSEFPKTMEQVGQGNGYLLYRHTINYSGSFSLLVPGIRDRGYVTLNEQTTFVGVLSRNTSCLNINLYEGDVMDILVQNEGRDDYSLDSLNNQKGIVGNATLQPDNRVLKNWEMHYIDILNMEWCPPVPGSANIPPSIYSLSFSVEDSRDTFVDTYGWGKGSMLLNGFHLGQYWMDKGPQQTLYAPASITNAKGDSLAKLTLLELAHDSCDNWQTSCPISLISYPLLSLAGPPIGNERATLLNSFWDAGP